MASVRITFDASALLSRLNQIKTNFPKALRAVGMFYLTDAQQRIGNGNSNWPAWSKSYAKYVAKHPHEMLWDSGTLVRSLTVGDSNNIFEQDDNSVTIGSNVRYAAAQQYGYPSRNLPARPYFIMDDADKNAQAGRVFIKYLLGIAS